MPLIGLGAEAPPPIYNQRRVGARAVGYEGLLYDPSPFIVSGDILEHRPGWTLQDANAGACPPGYRDFSTWRSVQPGSKGDYPTRWGCIRESISPKPPTWVAGAANEPVGASCPSGMVEYAPWARPFLYPIDQGNTAFKDWRLCKSRADLALERPLEPGSLLYEPMCFHRGPGYTYTNPTTGQVVTSPGPGQACLAFGQDAAAPADFCPSGFVHDAEASVHSVLPIRYCKETTAQRLLRLAPFTRPELTPTVSPDEVSTPAESVPGWVKETFVEPEDAPAAKLSVFGIEMPPVAVMAAGVVLAFLLFGRR